MIESKRLICKAAREGDIDYIIKLENAKENKNYVWQGNYQQHIKEIEDSNHILSLIYDKENMETVGYFLAALDMDLNIFELRRIVIDKKGCGYGKEIMKAIIDYSFKELNINRFWLDVYPDNNIAINLYESLNMVKEGVLRENYKDKRGYHDQIIYSILRKDYLNS